MATNITTVAQLEAAITKTPVVAVHFWAPWCEPCAHMDRVSVQLAQDHSSLNVLRVEAEQAFELSEKYDVAAVPLFLLFKKGRLVDRVEGADVVTLVSKVTALTATLQNGTAGAPQLAPPVNGAVKLAQPPATGRGPPAGPRGQDTTERIRQLLSSQPVMLFMKGTPEVPRCGFSARVVGALRQTGSPFGTFDILEDGAVRQGLKEYSDWPTFPQLYVDGELVGGCDIVMEMAGSGELKGLVGRAGGKDEIDTAARMERLAKSHNVMLFMKGTPDAPRCGFSGRVVAALRQAGVPFGSFDILGDEEVRQGLKAWSDWPTYPQLFVRGELLGGCDIVSELAGSGALKQTIAEMQGS